MGRFDRHDPNPEEISEHDASATEKLRASVERQVRAVVDEAMARAVAIEDRAQVKANRMEQESQERASEVLRTSEERAGEVLRESQERAGEVLSAAIQRGEGMLQATNTLEEELGKVIASFRDEIALLNSELQAARADLAAPPRPAAPTPAQPEPEPVAQATPAPPPQAGAATTERPAAESAGEPGAAPAEETRPAGDDRARDMVRQQLIRLRESGRPREDAERYLGRFQQTGDYTAMLDEIYGQDDVEASRRRGFLRRR